ncbi:XRE family transcriptional regulator, partial [Fructobacillus cardui]|uniref:XRE family transcriptional regulator n=1 Tax=Fructobacillus cardui TaxID=2893170 RepID=UPI00200A5FC0
MPEKNIISSQIVNLRNSRGYTQDDLAKLLGYSKQTISNWETGLKTPRMGAIQKLADIFNVNKSYIIDGVKNPDKLFSIYEQLNDERKNNVYHYANDQLEEQNKVVQMPTTNTVEVYGAVSAGTGEYMVDNQPEKVDYSGTVPEHDFAVTVNGDSMTPLFDDK